MVDDLYLQPQQLSQTFTRVLVDAPQRVSTTGVAMVLTHASMHVGAL
jgi:hypothetical protein